MDNTLKIINHLGKSWPREFTLHELSKTLSIPYATFYSTIQDMNDLVRIRIVGKSKVIGLDVNNKINQSYLAISSEEEKKEYLQKHKTIKIVHDDLNTRDVVLLFGSYAKGEESERSDIDIMVINKKGDKTISFSKQETLLNKEINAIYFTESEFKSMLKDPEENVGKQALKGHIILNNPNRFWELVLDGIR